MTHEAESFTRNLPFLRPSNKGNRYKPPPWLNDKVQTFTIGLAAGVPSSQCPELLVHVAIKTPPSLRCYSNVMENDGNRVKSNQLEQLSSC